MQPSQKDAVVAVDVVHELGHVGIVVEAERALRVVDGEGEHVSAERGAAEVAHLKALGRDVFELVGSLVLGTLVGGLALVLRLGNRAEMRAVHREDVAVLVDARLV